MTVAVQLRGGLGNQLFQYAAGYALSTRHGTDLQLNTALLPPSTVDRGGVRRWPEQVTSFDHAGSIVDSTGGSAARKRIAQSLAGRERALGDSRFRAALGARVYARETVEDIPAFERLPGDARINAYCNSWRYFADEAAEVSRQVRTLSDPSTWFTGLSVELDAARPIAVHVRWGDYLNLRHVYGTIGVGYYQRAVARVVAVTGERPLWVFSDDPEGAAGFLRAGLELDRVVVAPAESSPLENLLLLSRAAGIVCANSSFSWWAAFLSAGTPGSIVFPRPLFATEGPAEPKEWLTSEWIQVGRD